MEEMPGKRTHIDVTAYHEAGHAIAALQLGRYVYEVSASHNSPGNGLTAHARDLTNNPFTPSDTPGSVLAAWEHTLSKTRDEMRILLAGPLAEAKALGQPLRSLGAYSDLEKCRYLARRLDILREYLCGLHPVSEIRGRIIMNQVRHSTRLWVGRKKIWNLIDVVASALMEHGEINGADLGYLVGKASETWNQKMLSLR